SGSSRRRRLVPSASTSPEMGPSTSSGTRATSRRSEPGTSGTSWPTGYARADSPSTGCWSRTCARSPRPARSGGPGADEDTLEGSGDTGRAMSQENVEVVKRANAFLNQGDWDAMTLLADPDVVF